MEHIVCSFLVFLCGSMTHLRISLRFFFSHLRGCSLDQFGKNSLRMRSKSHNLKIDSKNKNLLQMSQVSPHISTYHLHSDAWYPSKWQNLQSAPWQFRLHPEVSAEWRLSNLSPLPIRHPDVLKRWNWHLGCGIHTDFFEALLWLAYICLYWYYTDSNDTMLNLWLKIQSSNHPIRINSSGKDSVQPFGWFALPTLGLGATLWCAWNRWNSFQASKHCPLSTWSILKESFVLIVSCNTFQRKDQECKASGFSTFLFMFLQHGVPLVSFVILSRGGPFKIITLGNLNYWNSGLHQCLADPNLLGCQRTPRRDVQRKRKSTRSLHSTHRSPSSNLTS